MQVKGSTLFLLVLLTDFMIVFQMIHGPWSNMEVTRIDNISKFMFVNISGCSQSNIVQVRYLTVTIIIMPQPGYITCLRRSTLIEAPQLESNTFGNTHHEDNNKLRTMKLEKQQETCCTEKSRNCGYTK